ncbi:hypothetical protein [Actinomadura macrotermitis]|uniref:Uncharacterized protein n=1 Tax=Actinomadura macrotermitis TaxID=2585200 RepID=A0A7K0BQV9_9ACTN|nr:hypothetical protein [Actinomadura macrotermitis]MQY03531.1 hypothetical protein [Actinomadura macrotermitis]
MLERRHSDGFARAARLEAPAELAGWASDSNVNDDLVDTDPAFVPTHVSASPKTLFRKAFARFGRPCEAMMRELNLPEP